MITLGTAKEQATVVDTILAANNGEPTNVRISLTAHGEDPFSGESTLDDLSERLEKAEWGQDEIPITLDASIASYLPRRLADARMRLITEHGGVPVEQLRGEKTMFLPGADAYTTDLISSSAGSLLYGRDSIKLNEFVEYPGVPAHQVAYDAARRLPYDRPQIDIEVAEGVVVVWVGHTGNPGMFEHEPAGEILNRLADDVTVGYQYRDTASGGFRAWLPKPLGITEAFDVPDHRRYAAAQLPNWDLQRPMPPPERFTDVRVFHRSPVDNKLLWEVWQEVPYPPDVRPPHANRTLHIHSQDASVDGPYHGNQRALREALDIARRVSTGDELVLPSYDPLLEKFDPVQVTEPRRDDDGLWEVVWQMRTETYRHVFDGSNDQGGTLSSKIAYTATILSEERIDTPFLLIPRPTGGVVGTQRPSYGVEGEEIYFDSPTPWVFPLGDELIFDTANFGNINIVGDEMIVSE